MQVRNVMAVYCEKETVREITLCRIDYKLLKAKLVIPSRDKVIQQKKLSCFRISYHVFAEHSGPF